MERLLSSATLSDVVSALAHRYDNALVVPQSLTTPAPTKPNLHNTLLAPAPLTDTRPVITKVLIPPQALENFSRITARTGLSRDYLLDLLLEWDITQPQELIQNTPEAHAHAQTGLFTEATS